MHPRLERELESDEPKCKNCRFWVPIEAHGSLGACLRIDIKAGSAIMDTALKVPDLSVCSGWEHRRLSVGCGA